MTKLDEATGSETVSVFVPSSPTAFSGYVMVVPRREIVELPMTVEEAMRFLVSGGVIRPAKPSGDAPVLSQGAGAPEVSVATPDPAPSGGSSSGNLA